MTGDRTAAKAVPTRRTRPSVVFAARRVAVRAMLLRAGMSNPRVFGSVLHGTDTEDSDLDLLVDAPAGTTLFDLGCLQLALERLLGVPVNLLTPGDLGVGIRTLVLAEAAPV